MSWPTKRGTWWEHSYPGLGQNVIDAPIISAKFPGMCPLCQKRYPKNATIIRRDGRWTHERCARKASIRRPEDIGWDQPNQT